MKWIYEEELYRGFFANIATTPSKQMRFSRYAQMMLDWSTTDLTEREILEKYNYSIRGRNPCMRYIKQMCQKLNPKLFKACERLRREIKSKSPILKRKVAHIDDQSRPL